MALLIINNIIKLTEEEKKELLTCKSFEYLYGIGLIFLKSKNNSTITWDCSDSAAARDYLIANKIKEITIY